MRSKRSLVIDNPGSSRRWAKFTTKYEIEKSAKKRRALRQVGHSLGEEPGEREGECVRVTCVADACEARPRVRDVIAR